MEQGAQQPQPEHCIGNAARPGPMTYGPACCAEPFDHEPSDHMTYSECVELQIRLAPIREARGRRRAARRRRSW
jgi:hypothetical protein